MQTKEELLEIEQRLLVEMGRRYGAHLEKAAAARRARSRERARRAVKRRSREYERLAAMAAEAKRRGLSYGQLMAGTTEYERNQIVQKRRKT